MLLSICVCLLVIFPTILSSSIILNRSGKRGCFCFLFHLKSNAFRHSPLNIMLTGFSIASFISLRQFFSCFLNWKIFIINVCWIFQVFFCIYWNNYRLFFLCSVITWVASFKFWIWNQLYIQRLNSTWSFFKEKYI